MFIQQSNSSKMPLGLMISSSIDFWSGLKYQAWSPSCGKDFKSK